MTSRQQEPQRGPGMLPRWAWWLLLLTPLVWFVFPSLLGVEETPAIPYTRFLEEVEAGNVERVEIEGDAITGELAQPITVPAPEGTGAEPSEASRFRTTHPSEVADGDLVSLLRRHDVVVEATSPSVPFIQQVLVSALPFLLIFGLLFWFWRRAMQRQAGGGIMDFGRSKARVTRADRPEVTFEHVAAQDQAKEELAQVVDFLRSPGKYHDIGARLPRGVLLVGPPGTGKTLLGRAVAGEAHVPFFNLSATEFVEMFVGVGASRVRDLFEKAKERSPSIVFIDELDAVGRRRGAGVGQANDEREQTLNQLLDQMDGFDEQEEVVVLAATNRPDVLDPALQRPGRFDRQVVVGLPDRRGREEILRIHTRRLPVAPEVDLEVMARRTMGMSGADLANLCNEAALVAARNDRHRITEDDFESALDKLVLGGRREPPMDERERELVAYHEGGHALVAWRTASADPVRKVTIVPHGRAAGATTQLPEDERHAYRRAYLVGRLSVMLAGRAAEEVALEEVSTGAESDLVQATRLARRMVTRWGMGTLGPIAFQTDDENPFLGYELAQHREVSDHTAARIDRDVERLIGERYQSVVKLVGESRRDLDELVAALMEEETVDAARLQELLGPRAGDD